MTKRYEQEIREILDHIEEFLPPGTEPSKEQPHPKQRRSGRLIPLPSAMLRWDYGNALLVGLALIILAAPVSNLLRPLALAMLAAGVGLFLFSYALGLLEGGRTWEKRWRGRPVALEGSDPWERFRRFWRTMWARLGPWR